MTVNIAKEELEALLHKSPTANKIRLKCGYDFDVVLDIVLALKIIEALKEAEEYDTSDWEIHKIRPITKTKIEMTMLSNEEYTKLKTIHLLTIYTVTDDA